MSREEGSNWANVRERHMRESERWIDRDDAERGHGNGIDQRERERANFWKTLKYNTSSLMFL